MEEWHYQIYICKRSSGKRKITADGNKEVEITDILVKAVKSVKSVFEKLSDLKNPDLIKQRVISVNKLEEQGDRVYEKIVSNLYKEEKNPIELMKWMNIYKCFEETIDSCEQISDCIQDVIMKNS